MYTQRMTTFKKQPHDDTHGNALVWLLVLIALAIAAFFIFSTKRPASEVVDSQSGTPVETTVLEGEVVCLPHRDTSGPTTMECTYGVETIEGNYYGLDGSQLPTDKQGGYQTGTRIAFEGTLLTSEQMPESFWNTYNIVGILQVQDYWEYRDK